MSRLMTIIIEDTATDTKVTGNLNVDEVDAFNRIPGHITNIYDTMIQQLNEQLDIYINKERGILSETQLTTITDKLTRKFNE